MICNGIDTDQLAAFGEMVVTDPAAATLSAQVRTRWEGSYRTRASAEGLDRGGERIPRAATLPTDRPQALGGGDRGPAPGELLLVALGACVAQSFIEGAAIIGLRVDRLEISAEGVLDLRGNAGVAGVRPGLSRVHLDVEVESGAGSEVLEGLLAEAVRRSPVADSLAAGVEIGAGVRQPPPDRHGRHRGPRGAA
jgi:putative redox protein